MARITFNLAEVKLSFLLCMTNDFVSRIFCTRYDPDFFELIKFGHELSIKADACSGNRNFFFALLITDKPKHKDVFSRVYIERIKAIDVGGGS